MLVIAVIVTALLILVMIKLSELNGRLVKIQTDVQALKDSVGDPAIPADAEAAIVAIENILNPPPPNPIP